MLILCYNNIIMDNFPDVDEMPKPLGDEHGRGFNDKHFESPNLPGKIIKEAWELGANDQEKTDRAIDSSKAYLEMLTKSYGISVAPHYFVIGPSLLGEGQALFCIQDRIERSTSLEALVKYGDSEALNAGAMLTGKVLDHVDDVIKKGGGLQPEFFRYDQYVFQKPSIDPDNFSGPSDRLILVDTEPFAPLRVSVPEERREKNDFSTIFWALQICAEQVIELAKHNRGEDTTRYLLSIVDSLPDSNGLKKVKDGVKDCVERRDFETLRTFLEEQEFPDSF